MPLLLDAAMTLAERIGLLAACVAAATATYFGIERPLRSEPWARYAPWFLTGGLLLVGTLGWLVYSSDGFLQRYPAAVRAVAEVDARPDYDSYRVDRCFLRSEQTPTDFTPDCIDPASAPGPLMLLWGDSHAAALYPGLRAMAQAQPGGLRLAQFTAAACPPGWPHAMPDNRHCAAVNQHTAERIATLHPDVVVLAANWQGPAHTPDDFTTWAPQPALQDTLKALRAAGVPRVIVVGPLLKWPVAPPRLLLRAWAEGDALPARGDSGLDEEALALDRALEGVAQAAGAGYRSPIKALCDLRGCLLSVQENGVGHAVAFDPTHLTAVGSRRLVQLLNPWF
jgi:SGNH domain (fused to AT3 domains)